MKLDERKSLKVAIHTFGCQMNEYDGEVAAGILGAAGFEIAGEGDADVILMNTCSVREHAEERVFSRLGMLGKVKRTRPELIVGLMGCMVEEHREKLFKRFHQLDLMVGTRNIKELPSLIEEVRRRRQQVARIKQDGISIEYTDLVRRTSKLHAWLPIMTGCDKVCTFCIVPVTRGGEVSMPAREVYREASRLVGEGVKWITLLGQNVNSYRGEGVAFPQLLELLCQIDRLERISFTTSHPSDATEELFQTIARNPKISRRFHLPLQSGSDRILKRMKRLHTYEDYKKKVNRLRELAPDVSLTTDIIVGFSGEAEEDYEATKRALAEVRYDGAYIYKYSVRPTTPAAKLTDDVPYEVKEERNQELLRLQKEIEREKNRSWLGRQVGVFVEGRSPKRSDQLLGRTLQEKKVVFDGAQDLVGTFQTVTLLDIKNETFVGALESVCVP
ncbi:MAG: tRNA (N6-isopentenyl adenosine(37)-C2)-methylthiotransferase MiaB [Candidatus Omnitrophica bacterium]|nr:tRNA (N6-isopentenyl adenosine(37)-C2)-methylthiotransferase MiaB [Candidatus Omnitrophota bacterium]